MGPTLLLVAFLKNMSKTNYIESLWNDENPKLPIKKLVLAHFGFWENVSFQKHPSIGSWVSPWGKNSPTSFSASVGCCKGCKATKSCSHEHKASEVRMHRLGSREIGWEDTVQSLLMAGPTHQLRLVGSWHPIIYDGFGKHPNGGWLWDFWLPSPQYVGLSGFYQLMVWVGGFGPGGCNKTSICM